MIPKNPTGTASPPLNPRATLYPGVGAVTKKKSRVSRAFLGTPNVENLKLGLNEGKRHLRLRYRGSWKHKRLFSGN